MVNAGIASSQNRNTAADTSNNISSTSSMSSFPYFEALPDVGDGGCHEPKYSIGQHNPYKTDVGDAGAGPGVGCVGRRAAWGLAIPITPIPLDDYLGGHMEDRSSSTTRDETGRDATWVVSASGTEPTLSTYLGSCQHT
ncbi:hypothetical protein CIB48_g1423 [Xylaria polymorpha]|nr:hypothetical protein CIB48_g1423 [Xylaria polymorpha]